MKTGDLIMLGIVAVGGYFIYTNWASISAALTLPAAAPASGASAAIPASPGGLIPATTPPAVAAPTMPIVPTMPAQGMPSCATSGGSPGQVCVNGPNGPIWYTPSPVAGVSGYRRVPRFA
jgi:hypothetical protein